MASEFGVSAIRIADHALDPPVKSERCDDAGVTGAGWFDDPRGAAELRWFDGELWTEHVSTGGRAWSSPLDEVPAAPAAAAVDGSDDAPSLPATRDVLALDTYVVARPSQPRGHGSSLEIYDDEGPLGRVVESEPEELAGSAVVRLVTASGAPVVSLTHPGGSGRARVESANGPIGFLSRVGRVRANLEVHGPGRRPEGEPLLVLKPLQDKGGWVGPGVEVRSWPLGQATANAYADARYQVTLDPAIGADLRLLLLALPVLVDRSLTQVVAGDD
jgi:hypothetical protein